MANIVLYQSNFSSSNSSWAIGTSVQLYNNQDNVSDGSISKSNTLMIRNVSTSNTREKFAKIASGTFNISANKRHVIKFNYYIPNENTTVIAGSIGFHTTGGGLWNATKQDYKDFGPKGSWGSVECFLTPTTSNPDIRLYLMNNASSLSATGYNGGTSDCIYIFDFIVEEYVSPVVYTIVEPIRVTLSEIRNLMSNSKLIKNQSYIITDSSEPDIVVKAINTSALSEEALTQGGGRAQANISSNTDIVRRLNIPVKVSTDVKTANSTGIVGDISITSDYLYVCVSTDVWKRIPLETIS